MSTDEGEVSRLLLVEDDALARRALVRMLR